MIPSDCFQRAITPTMKKAPKYFISTTNVSGALISNVSFFVADVCLMKSAQISCAALAECEPLSLLTAFTQGVGPPLTTSDPAGVYIKDTHLCVSVLQSGTFEIHLIYYKIL